MSEVACESELGVETAAVLAELARREPEFVGFAARRLGSEHEARDAVQSAYLRAIERLPSLREASRAVPWFYRILRNLVTDQQGALERKRRRWSDEPTDDLEDPGLDSDATCCCGIALVPRLPASHAQVIAWIDLEGRSIQEVAATLQIMPNALGVRLHRARAALREALAAHCGTTAIRACASCECGRPS
jgi:RNA polymerase sigma-70 factor (ECF subfamily)